MNIAKYITILILYPVVFFSQEKDLKGYIEFPECKNSLPVDKDICNEYELKKFITYNITHFADAKNSQAEGKIWIEYVLTEDKDLLVSITENSNNDSKLKKSTLLAMSKLKDSIQSGKINIIPAQLNGKKVVSYFMIPIEFTKVKNETYFNNSDSRKIVIATYRTSEKTIQFRRDLKGIIYAYSLSSNKEKLIGKIDSNKESGDFSNTEKSLLFLYNITFLKSEILLTMGNIDGQYFELYMDKSTSDTQDESVGNSNGMNINVYSSKNLDKPVETFKSIDELFNSKYLPLLFK
ncbi:hypothetical protein O2K51_08855 [Apibacter raozihei]|uniref:hypothetical protein n=1 Tax=Apibacter raozihei TaxID=2500547 RepID=UPI000FE3E9EF|nr:hypothetical protein [Apibacter raozihei]